MFSGIWVPGLGMCVLLSHGWGMAVILLVVLGCSGGVVSLEGKLLSEAMWVDWSVVYTPPAGAGFVLRI